jgi:Mlc titration factor MtfA (ptsG expression regulator)
VVFRLFQSKRQHLLEEPFPEEWRSILASNVLFYNALNESEKSAIEDLIKVVVGEKSWEGCKGLVLTDEIHVTIAAQASRLILTMKHDYFSNVESILVYPYNYMAIDKVAGPDSAVSLVPNVRLGEAWSQGPVILSWPEALAGGRNEMDGRNVVYHEFAHKLDFSNGSADGVPRLHDQKEYDRWSAVMSAEFEALVREREHGHHRLLNTYGATNAAEFFAVSTECFFERAQAMRHIYPELYNVLCDYFQQDPAAG